jgi:hypothetical protein
VREIDKFPFASDANATNVGNLSEVIYGVAGQSSTTFGYSSAGQSLKPPLYAATNTIEKFPFAADGNATDVGDLTVARWQGCGQQV